MGRVAEAIALVSVVSGAAVAILVPFIGARLERSRLVQQSRDVRLDELRGLLDDAVQNLYLAGTILYEILEETDRELPRPDWSDKRLLRLGQQLTEQTDVVNQNALRIKLRTPKGAAISAVHQDAVDAIALYEVHFRQFIESELREQEKPPPAPLEEVGTAAEELVAEVRTFAGVVEAPVRLR